MANGNGYGNGGGGSNVSLPGTKPGRGTGLGGVGGGTTMTPRSTEVNLALGGILETGQALTLQTKVTKGYFTGDAGLLTSNKIYTGSLGSANSPYYYNITNTHPTSASVATQFSVAFGHKGGSGSNCLDADGEHTLKGATQAVYQQFASLVLPESEISGGFQISNQGTAGVHYGTQAADDYVYILVGNRARFKDEMDYGSWTLKLSGSNSQGSGSSVDGGATFLSLTDDSKDTDATPTNSIFGRRFNVVSGSAGTTTSSNAAAHRTFGHFYPEAGFMVLSGAELSASIPGRAEGNNMTASFLQEPGEAATNAASCSGFSPNLNNAGDCKNALRFVNCIRMADSEEQRFRSVQVQNKKSYFLTVPAGACNFSTNPTFVSGSTSKIRHKSMYGNPNVFISTVGLHRSDGRLIAVAKLSTPINKNFGVQPTIKVNLTY